MNYVVECLLRNGNKQIHAAPQEVGEGLLQQMAEGNRVIQAYRQEGDGSDTVIVEIRRAG